MKYGVTITRGAAPWQIFQQNEDGFAAIRLEGEYHLVRLSQELPLEFTSVPDAKTTVKARIALESTGESVVPWTLCEVTGDGHWRIEFPRVPAGGLYRIETYMDLSLIHILGADRRHARRPAGHDDHAAEEQRLGRLCPVRRARHRQ